MNDKMLTIVVPAYNVQQYIGQCLNSLLYQTCDRFNVIIVDDGSKDQNTSSICKSFAAAHPDFVQYIHQENKGLGAARNTGLAMVETPFVSFLDSDDWLDIRFVEYVLEALEHYDDDGIDIVFTLPAVYDNISGQMSDWMDKGTLEWIFPEQSRVVDMGMDTRPFLLEPNACRRVYRTSFLKRNDFRFPEGTRWEDVYPHFFLLTHARKCMSVPEVGFFYRTNVPTSITATSGKGRLEVPTVFEATFQYLLQGGYGMEIMNSALKMCVNFSTWSISVSQEETRRQLVEKLHTLYASLPKRIVKDFLRSQGLVDKKGKLFVRIIRSRKLYRLLNDYLYEGIANAIFWKLKRK